MLQLQHKITPFLCYEHQASDAAALCIRLFDTAALQCAHDGSHGGASDGA